MTYHLPPEELKQAAENEYWRYVSDAPILSELSDQQKQLLHEMAHVIEDETIIAANKFVSPTLDKALEALESVQWVDINERLPEKNIAVLARQKNPFKHFETLILGYDGIFFRDFNPNDADEFNPDLFDEGFYANVTHWMPLPNTAKITEAINEIKKLKG